MGTPLPANEPGDNCIVCWGAGKPFGAGSTPRAITLTLTNLRPGEFWVPAHQQLLLTPHLLEQGGFPCTYAIDDGTFIWVVFWTITSTQIDVFRSADNKSAFRKGTAAECQTSLESQHIVPAGVIAFDALATVSWSLAGLGS